MSPERAALLRDLQDVLIRHDHMPELAETMLRNMDTVARVVALVHEKAVDSPAGGGDCLPPTDRHGGE